MWNGKRKAVTFSYDDGVTQDKRLIGILNRYGLFATFNLNSGLLGRDGSLLRGGVTVSHVKNKPEEVATIYAGHEVASHTLTHPFLPSASEEKILAEVEEDRRALSALCGYEVCGFAYPCGGANYDARVAALLREKTGVSYARTIECSGNFELQKDLYTFRPTVYHMDFDTMETLGKAFLGLSPDRPQLFSVWGHAYEFDIADTWDRFERFCRMISGHGDIFYGTNREVLLDLS